MSNRDKANAYADKVNEMGQHASTAQRVATQYEAHMSLFQVAAANQDPTEMELQRDKLHGLLDSMLDSAMSLGKLRGEAEALLRSMSQQE